MRHRRLRDIVIELTSLLDVVMILIFAVMIQNAKLVEETQGKLREANTQLEEYAGISEELNTALGKLSEGEIEELLERLGEAESRAEAYEYMDKVVHVVNVSLENKYNNTKRVLSYGIGPDNYKSEEINRTAKEDWKKEINSLKLYINNTITEFQEENQEMPIYIIFSVDSSKVYWNDFEDVERVIKNFNDIVYYPNELQGVEE